MKHMTILLLNILIACQPATEQAGQSAQTDPLTPSNSNTEEDVAPDTSNLERARAMGFDVQYLMGRFDPAEHPDFTQIPGKYADREGLLLRKDTYEAFLRMHEAAQADGVQLVIRSATRNFNYQKGIWERKWTGQRKLSSGENAAHAFPNPEARALEILKYSSMPGTSRHHWGTDIDLNSFNNSYFEQGEGKKIYDWLSAHAAHFGFCQPYSPKGPKRPNGYNEEKWHWSYLPVAQPLTALAKAALKNEMITGFKGAETATDIMVVDNYVLGINDLCMTE
jgi:LAS superfamily LD-carboxypeptidase LdcB